MITCLCIRHTCICVRCTLGSPLIALHHSCLKLHTSSFLLHHTATWQVGNKIFFQSENVIVMTPRVVVYCGRDSTPMKEGIFHEALIGCDVCPASVRVATSLSRVRLDIIELQIISVMSSDVCVCACHACKLMHFHTFHAHTYTHTHTHIRTHKHTYIYLFMRTAGGRAGCLHESLHPPGTLHS